VDRVGDGYGRVNRAALGHRGDGVGLTNQLCSLFPTEDFMSTGTTMADLAKAIEADVAAAFTAYQAEVAKLHGLSSFYGLATRMVATFVSYVDSYVAFTGPIKKQVVIDTIMGFYKAHVLPIGIPGVGGIAFDVFNQFFLMEGPMIVGGIVDGIVAIARLGISLPAPTPTPIPTPVPTPATAVAPNGKLIY
jgi:hypothetical protein